MSDGYTQPDHLGRFVVGSGRNNRKHKELEAQERQKRNTRCKIGQSSSSNNRDGKIRNRARKKKGNVVEGRQYQRKKYKSYGRMKRYK